MNYSKQEILEQTAIAFFHAIRERGKERHGHDQFGFKLEIQTMSPNDNRDAALGFGADIQAAITIANRAVQPVTIAGDNPAMRSVLITGGAGAFGTAMAKHLLNVTSPVERIAIYSRGEHRQAVMAQELVPLDPYGKLRFLIGDIRDKDRLRRAFRGVDTIFHAAALKRIETANYNTDELVRTNVVGTQNVIDAAMDAGVEKAVFLSSDKAHQPISPYGHSKALAERMFLMANNMRGTNGPHFVATRYGNVWRSTGSVVPTWEAILASGKNTVPVTDPECTRFFMTMDEAIDLVLRAIVELSDDPLVPTLPAYRLGDLAEAMGQK